MDRVGLARWQSGRLSLTIFCLHVAWRFVVPPAVGGETLVGVRAKRFGWTRLLGYGSIERLQLWVQDLLDLHTVVQT